MNIAYTCGLKMQQNNALGLVLQSGGIDMLETSQTPIVEKNLNSYHGAEVGLLFGTTERVRK